MNKTISIVMFVFLFIFLIGLYSLLVQNFDVNSNVLATLIGGMLSMLGGAIGALGAYYVSINQMKKELDWRDKEAKISNRPVINCSIITNVREDLSNIIYEPSTMLLSEKNIYDTKSDTFTKFYTIKFSGNINVVENVEITLIKDQKKLEYYIGSVNSSSEILMMIPQDTCKYNGAKEEKVEIIFITQRQERMKFIYDNINCKQQYFLLNDGNEELIDSYDFKAGNWQLIGRDKERV